MKGVGFGSKQGGGVVSRTVKSMKTRVSNVTRALGRLKDQVVGGMKFMSTSQSNGAISKRVSKMKAALLQGTAAGGVKLSKFATMASSSISNLFNNGLGSRVSKIMTSASHNSTAGLTSGGNFVAAIKAAWNHRCDRGSWYGASEVFTGSDNAVHDWGTMLHQPATPSCVPAPCCACPNLNCARTEEQRHPECRCGTRVVNRAAGDAQSRVRPTGTAPLFGQRE